MANKQISQLPAASVMNDGDLLVCEQNGVAKRLTGSILMAMINSHGGITGSSYTPPVAPSLQGTLTLTFTDGTSTEVPIMNGAKGATGAQGAQGEKGDPFTFDDFTPEQLESLRGEQGAQGVPGNPGYCHIKWSAVEPTSNADMGDLPDEWMGIYSGSSATAPTDYTAYVWYKIKGAQGYRGATGAPGANGTKIYLSNAAPLLYDGYYYFDSGFLVSPDRQIGVSPARGDLVLYRNSLYSATGLTDIVRGERCVFGYNIVLNTATDEQVQDAVDEYLSSHPTVTGTFTNEAKNALLTLLEKVAYTVSDGQTYLETLRTELFRINVDSISAVFTQGSAVIYNTDPLDTLKQYLVVTATYSDSTTEVLSDSVYTLSGTLTVGTSTITVTYGGKTTTFNVAVTGFLPAEYQLVEWVGSTGEGQVINTGITNADGMQTITDAQYTNADAYDYNYQLVGLSSDYSGLYVAVIKGTASQGWRFGISGTSAFTTTKNKVLQRFTITSNWSKTTATATFDGQTISHTRSGSDISSLQLKLWAANGTNVHGATARIYSVKSYKNGALISDIWPCYRKADGVIGMYDRARDAFLVNEGNGTLTKGDDV